MHAPFKSLTQISTSTLAFDEDQVLHALKHHLPTQASLKDFIHHNTLHAFQHLPFFEGVRQAHAMFGYKTLLSLRDFRKLHAEKAIRDDVLDRTIVEHHGQPKVELWRERMLKTRYNSNSTPRVGALRALWKSHYQLDLDSLVHPKLFRILNSFLDQGVSIWHFPIWNLSFLDSIRELEQKSFTSLFQSPRVRTLLFSSNCSIETLLHLLVGREELFETYLFDQQFAHPGWSGMVSVIEDRPGTLLDQRKVSLRDLILFELLLEIDALDSEFGDIWMPLGGKALHKLEPLFAPAQETELSEVLRLWQEAYEWSYYDSVLAGLSKTEVPSSPQPAASVQAIFCIDDRECSLRRHLENLMPNLGTFSTPGHFGIDAYYQPQDGKFVTKICPAPLTPRHLIKELDDGIGHQRDVSYAKNSHGLLSGFLFSQTIGFWSALKLLFNIFRPSVGAATTLAFQHMSERSQLTVEHKGLPPENGLQVGFTLEEMANRVESVLHSMGLLQHFAPLVYVVGHGSSSVNNTHFAGYDCGACSGRPGSVNSRAFAFMANHPQVRDVLEKRGLRIPQETQFLGGLHDTARDEIRFFDENLLTPANRLMHENNKEIFHQALNLNAKERSRRFELAPQTTDAKKLHQHVKERTVSLFEPRPELNHATNALCIVGTRQLTRSLFLDRRAFLNSYDASVDPEGNFLLGILNAAAPVCGGINLEYFFSRVDNERLGAGTKLPHNVMGLIGVANGMEGDLRTGLPSQMIEVHDPIRLLIIVEHLPEIVKKTITQNPATYEWFEKEWVRLAVVHPQTRQTYIFSRGNFHPYTPLLPTLEIIKNLPVLLETSHENIPVMWVS